MKMSQKQIVKPANDDAAECVVVETRHGQVTFEDFSIDHIMASFDDDAKEDAGTQRQD